MRLKVSAADRGSELVVGEFGLAQDFPKLR
jgi:hypothetical protein